MADLNSGFAYIDEVKLYGPPNPALAAILVGTRLRSIVGSYTLMVAGQYMVRQGAMPYRDRGRQHRAGGHRPGQSVENIEAGVDIGGFKKDRWVGQITIGVEYSGASEYGRKKYARYRGNSNLRESLGAVLPTTP